MSNSQIPTSGDARFDTAFNQKFRDMIRDLKLRKRRATIALNDDGDDYITDMKSTAESTFLTRPPLVLNMTLPLSVTPTPPDKHVINELAARKDPHIINDMIPHDGASKEGILTRNDPDKIIKNPYKKLTRRTPLPRRKQVSIDILKQNSNEAVLVEKKQLNRSTSSKCNFLTKKSQPIAKDDEFWTCRRCTLRNLQKSWSRTRQKCNACHSFREDT